MRGPLQAALLAVLFGLAAPAGAKVLEDIIASVNGKPILLTEYRKNLQSVLDQYRKNLPQVADDADAMKQVRQKVLDQMVDDELLSQHADDEKVKVTEREIDNGVDEVKTRFRQDDAGKSLKPDEADEAFKQELKKEGLSTQTFRDRLKKQLSVRKLVEEKIRPNTKPPTEDEVKAYYNKMMFIVNGDTSVLKGLSEMESQQMTLMAGRLKDAAAERVRARHILIKLPKDASMVDKSKAIEKLQDIRKQIMAGADFGEMAQKYSDDTESAKRGGDLGFFLKGWMVPEFEKAAFALQVGQVSDVVETPFGYHLIKVEEKKAAHKPAFEEIQDQLTQAMYSMRIQKQMDKLVQDLRAKASIEVLTPVDKVTLK